MTHFDECNIKAWEGADNPPPWCNCQIIAEVEVKAREDESIRCIRTVRTYAETLPRWDHLGTHSPGCDKHHPECALLVALGLLDGQNGTEKITDQP